MAVTRKNVFDAIESLEKQGLSATNAAILEITGGSNVTVQKYRKEYFEQRQEQAIRESIVLKDAEMTAITEVFSSVLKGRIDVVQEQSSAALKLVGDALEKVSDDLDTALLNLSEKEAEIEKLRLENTTLSNNYNFQEQRHSKDKQELKAEIQRLNELAFTHKGKAEILEERIKKYESTESGIKSNEK